MDARITSLISCLGPHMYAHQNQDLTDVGNDLEKAKELRDDLLHALSLALPFVEDALEDPCYKDGTVAKTIRTIKDALARAEA